MVCFIPRLELSRFVRGLKIVANCGIRMNGKESTVARFKSGAAILRYLSARVEEKLGTRQS
jgi:hypothetical protein